MDLNCALNHSDTREAYDLLSPHYDELTSHHLYDRWFEQLIPVLEREGLSGSRLLDLGCGTGKSTLPLVDRGWQATAVDVSPGMLRELERKAGNRVQVHCADIAELPRLGQFDLVLSLGEAMNYCAANGGFVDALRGVRRNLAPGGLVMFDLNTLRSYGTFFAERQTSRLRNAEATWRGQVGSETEPGMLAAGVMAISEAGGSNDESLHRQAHIPESEAKEALAAVGLELRAVYGHDYSGVLEQPLSQERHTKGIFISGLCHQTEERR